MTEEDPQPGSREWYRQQRCDVCGEKENREDPSLEFVWTDDEVLRHEGCVKY